MTAFMVYYEGDGYILDCKIYRDKEIADKELRAKVIDADPVDFPFWKLTTVTIVE